MTTTRVSLFCYPFLFFLSSHSLYCRIRSNHAIFDLGLVEYSSVALELFYSVSYQQDILVPFGAQYSNVLAMIQTSSSTHTFAEVAPYTVGYDPTMRYLILGLWSTVTVASLC
jgi:hypothetical protein